MRGHQHQENHRSGEAVFYPWSGALQFAGAFLPGPGQSESDRVSFPTMRRHLLSIAVIVSATLFILTAMLVAIISESKTTVTVTLWHINADGKEYTMALTASPDGPCCIDSRVKAEKRIRRYPAGINSLPDHCPFNISVKRLLASPIGPIRKVTILGNAASGLTMPELFLLSQPGPMAIGLRDKKTFASRLASSACFVSASMYDFARPVITTITVIPRPVGNLRGGNSSAVPSFVRDSETTSGTSDQSATGTFTRVSKALLADNLSMGRSGSYWSSLFVVLGSILALLMMTFLGRRLHYQSLARRQAEVYLRQTQQRLDCLMALGPPCALLTLDSDGHISRWSNQAERMTGYSADEVLGHPLSLLCSPESPAVRFQAASAERMSEQDTWLIAKDGSRIRGNIAIIAAPYEPGWQRQFTIFLQDRTQRFHTADAIKKLRHTIHRQAAQLESTNKELESFSYSISHDLRTPLRSIDGFSQALLEDYSKALDETANDSLRRIRNATQRMGKLIDDLLALSQITRSTLRSETMDLSDLAQAVVDELHKQEPDRSVSVSIQQGMTTSGDPHLLLVALEHLLGNAWKFTSKRSDATITVGSSSDGVFFVRDNGAGFDMKYADKLFGAFQRLHSMDEFAGTGMGLALVQRIIHRHGGRIWANAEMGNGATFYFTISS